MIFLSKTKFSGNVCDIYCVILCYREMLSEADCERLTEIFSSVPERGMYPVSLCPLNTFLGFVSLSFRCRIFKC